MPFFYYYDPYYWMILVPAMLIALLAQLNVSSIFNRYSHMANRRGFTDAQAAETVLRAHDIQNVHVEQVSGRLTDHCNPWGNVIHLSDAIYGFDSIASVGAAAREASHAVQYTVGYGPIKLRSTLVPTCSIGSQLSLILIVIGLLPYPQPLFDVGVLLFAMAVVFQLVTLPVEFNASHRATASLEGTHLLEDDELRGVHKVLGAAAMTHVAALLVSLAQLLRPLLTFAGRRRN